MIYQLTVPADIEDVEEIRVLEWHRAEGSVVEAGQLLVELETHKALVEIRPSCKAYLRQILCREGDWQALGKPIALLSESADEPLPQLVDQEAALPLEFVIT